MEESQIILKLHEELLKTNRNLKYFNDECIHRFGKQRRINRFLTYCLISLIAKSAWKRIKSINEKGSADKK
ncbi:MAG: hypothetical protein Q4G33_07810 [bacterium]|nr:hypothetical protein [bacterium]